MKILNDWCVVRDARIRRIARELRQAANFKVNFSHGFTFE